MPPLGTPEFTIYLLPSQDQEEVPGAHARYQQDLARVIALNPWDPNDEGGEVEFNGMDGIEPEIGLMVWCDNVLQKVS
jgi:hypothetical protein